MGNFYSNVTVRGPSAEDVFDAIEQLGYHAFVAATVANLTVICEQQSDAQDKAIWLEVAKQLSRKLNCPALAVMNHDDDVLFYALYRNGTLLDEYDSCPDYWNNTEVPVAPLGGDAQALCDALGMPGNMAEVERVLRTSPSFEEDGDEDEFVFAWERHEALLRALNWPEVPYQQGFDYLRREKLAAGWRAIG